MTEQEKVQQAATSLRSAVESLRKGEYGAADEASDKAWTLIEDVRAFCIARIEELGTEVSPERDKLDEALSSLDDVNSELENLGAFTDLDEGAGEEVADDLEGIVQMLDELVL